jgi:hypothetical protein
MPRVHQMRTDLAQYYHSTKPSVRLQYITTLDEKVNFQINGTDLLSRELNVFTSTKVNQRQITDQIRNLALSNNTAGASIYDLGNLIKADSLAEITHTLKAIEEKVNAQRQQDQQAQQQQIEMVQKAETERQEQKLAWQAEQNQLDRDKDIYEAEIRSAGYTGGQDFNTNQQSDYIDTLEYLDKKEIDRQNISLKRESEINKQVNEQTKANLKREELQTRERIANKQVQVAAMNKNKYDKK